MQSLRKNRPIDLFEHVPTEMQQDRALVLAAIEGEADCFSWEDLPESSRLDPEIVVAAFEHNAIGWEDVPETLQRNHKVLALFGVKNSLIDADGCPCLLDRPFMKAQFSDHSFEWRKLPTELKTDIEFARSIERLPTVYHAHEIFDHFPVLRQDRILWTKVVDAAFGTYYVSPLFGSIRDYAPAEIRSDRELMLNSCAKDAKVLVVVDARLAADHGFLLEIAGRNFCVLTVLSHQRQLEFSDVVDRAFQQYQANSKVYSYTEIKQVAKNLAPELWSQRGFVLRWFRVGLPFLVRGGPFSENNERLRDWKKDKEIFLLIAKHCRFRYDSLWRCSEELRRDKNFMLLVLEIDQSLIRVAAPELRNDFDLCLLAFSGKRSAAEREVRSRQRLMDEGVVRYPMRFRAKLSKRLRAHRVFSSVVLPGMSQTTGSGCSLAILNQGAETSRAYKKRMAEYLDVPTGKRLRLHREASSNLDELIGGEGESEDA